MNVARGYRRFAIAVVGSWIATWAAIGAHAAWQQSVWSNVFISASRDRASVTELVLSNQKSQEYGELVGASMAWGALARTIHEASVAELFGGDQLMAR